LRERLTMRTFSAEENDMLTIMLVALGVALAMKLGRTRHLPEVR
jgi:hypothetical protein